MPIRGDQFGVQVERLPEPVVQLSGVEQQPSALALEGDAPGARQRVNAVDPAAQEPGGTLHVQVAPVALDLAFGDQLGGALSYVLDQLGG